MTMGAAMALGSAVSDPAYATVAFGGTFGSMTTENALKWQFVHPQENTYTFQEGDALVVLAKRHNMKIHGHALVFGEANPRWVQDLPVATEADKDKVKQVMLDHIKTVVGHYKDKMSTWDVVNEPLADNDNFDTDNGYTLRRHKWYQAMGQDYIAQAFQAAHAADPKAKLFINEYGMEEDGERWDTMYALVSQLKSQGVPIDGVGFQSHVYESGDRISAVVLRKHMQQLAKIGLLSRVSENDVYSDDGQTVQAQQYADVFSACLHEPSCISYTTWGVSDRYDTFRDDDGSIQYGQDFLWSDTMTPTPAVTKLQALLK
jgi:endo-1,4-beta-xylanase